MQRAEELRLSVKELLVYHLDKPLAKARFPSASPSIRTTKRPSNGF
jgi:hypothetical protein